MGNVRKFGASLAGAALVLSAVVAGGGTSAAGPDPRAQAVDAYAAAMGRDLGITEDQARTRVRQEATAMDVDPRARAAAGEAFGGSWFDAERGKLVVGLAGDDEAAAEAVRATGADVVRVDRTLAALDAAKAELDRVEAPEGVAAWRVDPERGALVVTVHDAKGAAGFVDAARELGPVVVEEVSARPATFAAGTVGGDPYYINGNTRCSIGFSVHGGFVSAGHCGGAGSSVVGWDGSAMGSFAGSSFPGNDYAFIRTGNGWWNAPVVLGWGSIPDRLVRGSNEAPVGSSICRSGSTTHWHCGTLLAKNETVNYQQGAVHQMTKTSVCAQPGDSGGSFITGDQAQGVTSGGWGNCSSGGETWYQPVREILSVYGLSLVTP
ncbi:S1 family peptidase [Actinosynnema mirum]|uniref:Peptidase S1 and S6 chymotrypsin/Hap n=1 Tax=Actinosynnema mirum (strain ATCC 29888 / DSM 43827 / JCM 3225 / NBRC 14064 / NCIMB 13271 / NRRL B-12336 / IMRU 3971 / 101) TaxID=446462 RepID=C6WLG6_ACTMD|nr:S1 family peptidase [Actinosynnema mirum]ACU38359.1 peptidase S1 and S6 chymotrypsin/Hap [Actinosynnema mirum DSM 43827]